MAQLNLPQAPDIWGGYHKSLGQIGAGAGAGLSSYLGIKQAKEEEERKKAESIAKLKALFGIKDEPMPQGQTLLAQNDAFGMTKKDSDPTMSLLGMTPKPQPEANPDDKRKKDILASLVGLPAKDIDSFRSTAAAKEYGDLVKTEKPKESSLPQIGATRDIWRSGKKYQETFDNGAWGNPQEVPEKPEKPTTSHLPMPTKQSPTGWGHFGPDVSGEYSRYLGPAPIPYGAADQPGMGQYVGPLEDDPTKGTIFVPKRGGGTTSTIDLPGRTSKKNLDSLPGQTKSALASARVAYHGISEAESLYNEALKGVTGPIEGRAQVAYSKIANSPKVTELQQKLGRTLASILRAESGLVVTDTERAYYEDHLLPMFKNPQANFEVLLRETKKWIQDIHDSNIDILRESNTESPSKLSELAGNSGQPKAQPKPMQQQQASEKREVERRRAKDGSILIKYEDGSIVKQTK